MRRNWSSLRGARGRAFTEAMHTPEEPRKPAPVVAAAVAERVCDRSGDAGSIHYWPEGATVGDWCLCGKRKRFTPFPPRGAA